MSQKKTGIDAMDMPPSRWPGRWSSMGSPRGRLYPVGMPGFRGRRSIVKLSLRKCRPGAIIELAGYYGEVLHEGGTNA